MDGTQCIPCQQLFQGDLPCTRRWRTCTSIHDVSLPFFHAHCHPGRPVAQIKPVLAVPFLLFQVPTPCSFSLVLAEMIHGLSEFEFLLLWKFEFKQHIISKSRLI
jgi:hypothetical protein